MLEKDLRLFWGDLHNHNAVGYAKGSLQRSIDIAREHLDFFAFTGHAAWHDMPNMPGDRHMHWVNGFKAHAEHWSRTRQLLREANDPNFVAMLGYEWHSSRFGDYCLIFPQDQPELYLPDHVEKLLAFSKGTGALAIPHHVAYKQGWRGANWDFFDPMASPVVEIFSEHGCTESDQAPFPMILHSNGGRSTANTIDYQLRRGRRFGFVASSDDHFGYPGAWGEGVVGVWARELTPASLFDAIRKRRTIAVTGDRISVNFSLNGQFMGEDLAPAAERRLRVDVQGQDTLKSIEIVKNGRIVQRAFPEDLAAAGPSLPGRVKCRLQYGWGPWSTLKLERICRWDMTVRVKGGRFLAVQPCFQSGPFCEELRDSVRRLDDSTFRLNSFTSRSNAYLEDATKAVVMEIEAGPDAVLSLELNEPTVRTFTAGLGDLCKDNLVEFTGVFTTESLMIHRPVGPEGFQASLVWEEESPHPEGTDWYYARVAQSNGQLAWSSPIWIGDR
jgi:hypothetical protein